MGAAQLQECESPTATKLDEMISVANIANSENLVHNSGLLRWTYNISWWARAPLYLVRAPWFGLGMRGTRVNAGITIAPRR